ncbi:MAG: TorF family putative porin [Luteimonas sp.]
MSIQTSSLFATVPASVGAILVGALLLSTAGRVDAADVSGNAALTSDYVWRGSTQSQGDAAVQAGFKLANASGWYGTVWASSVEFAPELHASTEIDASIGWGGKLSDDWALDVNLLRYQYPSTTVDLNWTELNGTLTWRDNTWLSLGWSPEALGSDEAGTYVQVGHKFPVNDALRLEIGGAHYFLDSVYDRSYSHAWASAVWMVKSPIELRLTAHATDHNAKTIFGHANAGSRIEAAVQASF